jgi:hypothetical protein
MNVAKDHFDLDDRSEDLRDLPRPCSLVTESFGEVVNAKGSQDWNEF